jgi:hypothetical protein
MIEHFLLFSRYIGNHGHLWPRDFKQVNEWFYSSADPLLPTTAVTNRAYFNSAATARFYYLKSLGRAKVYTQFYFFILKLKPQCNIQKTVKIKGCERPAYKFPSSYYREYLNVAAGQILLPKISRRSNDCFFNRTSTQRRLRHSRK